MNSRENGMASPPTEQNETQGQIINLQVQKGSQHIQDQLLKYNSSSIMKTMLGKRKFNFVTPQHQQNIIGNSDPKAQFNNLLLTLQKRQRTMGTTTGCV
jgi:hypothetical protein